ncbi:hypothetical protein Ciccas_012298 [Cichlidogyrus casuarinus]|uniref:Uncharacterized protein n=1 Tax=Cichlidogyrus casuarinus TaxID=1844966 RepID=A0ABD2PQ59_9PLAT
MIFRALEIQSRLYQSPYPFVNPAAFFYPAPLPPVPNIMSNWVSPELYGPESKVGCDKSEEMDAVNALLKEVVKASNQTTASPIAPPRPLHSFAKKTSIKSKRRMVGFYPGTRKRKEEDVGYAFDVMNRPKKMAFSSTPARQRSSSQSLSKSLVSLASDVSLVGTTMVISTKAMSDAEDEQMEPQLTNKQISRAPSQRYADGSLQSCHSGSHLNIATKFINPQVHMPFIFPSSMQF